MADIEIAFARAPVDRRGRRLPPVVVGVTLVALLALAVAKPWAIAPGPTAGAAIVSAPPSPAAIGAAIVNPSAGVERSPDASALPVAASAPPPSGLLDQTTLAKIVAGMAVRSGAWGVGTGGDGPRLLRDEPWTDWVAVDPGLGWNGSSLALWPNRGLCMSAPRLLNHPSLVAVTVPAGLVPDWRAVAWWTDGQNAASLAGVVRQIPPPGNRGITYLERIDQASWPDGRYEFDIQAGDHRSSLTVCIGAA